MSAEGSALERWYEAHLPVRTDRPRVHIWYPREAPYARLEVREHGHDPATLPPGPIHAYLTIAGYEIGGRLDELELLVAAAGEALQALHTQAAELVHEGES